MGYEGRPERGERFEELQANGEVGRRIYELRSKAGLTQAQLARMIGTTASVICRLEHADYEGHSLAVLRRIAGESRSALLPCGNRPDTLRSLGTLKPGDEIAGMDWSSQWTELR